MVDKELKRKSKVANRPVLGSDDLERRDARGQIFRRIFLITLAPGPRTTKFDSIAHVCGGEAYF